MFWSKKDTSKVKNTLLQWFSKNILESQTFQRIAKFSMVDSYEMDFMKNIVILVKTDEMYNILRWRWNSSFAGGYPLMPIRLLRPSFIKGHTSSCKRYSCRV